MGRKMIEVVGDLEKRNDATVYILKWQTGRCERERELFVLLFSVGSNYSAKINTTFMRTMLMSKLKLSSEHNHLVTPSTFAVQD